jgi:hypothetical protein
MRRKKRGIGMKADVIEKGKGKGEGRKQCGAQSPFPSSFLPVCPPTFLSCYRNGTNGGMKRRQGRTGEEGRKERP